MSLGLTINGTHVPPGSTDIVSLHVGKLPSGARITIKTHVFCSPKPGPTVLLLAGLHGDEINGIEILRRCLSTDMFRNLRKGNVLVIPILNIYGFINFSREVPDGKDVNRSFPGSMTGSLASRVARILTKKVLPVIDMAVDLHTGGDNRFNYPQIRYTRNDQASLALARDFAAPFVIEKGVIPKSLRKMAREQKIPMLVFEGGEALRLDGFVIETAMKGISRMFARQDMLHEVNNPRPEQLVHFRKTSWIRARQAGIFIWSKKSGTQIVKGETLGSIYDPSGSMRVPVIASRDGYILGHNNTPVVHQGDALFNIGYESEIVKL